MEKTEIKQYDLVKIEKAILYGNALRMASTRSTTRR